MTFSNKKILILSPDKWSNLQISKHHYALELAQKGNLVFFLNPPNNLIKKCFEIQKIEDNLFVVSYKLFIPLFIRFHFRFIYDFLMRFQIYFILKKINQKIDVLFSFETNVYSNLSLFKSDLKIYFPVDMIFGKYQSKIINSSDIIFSVSKIILDRVRSFSSDVPVHFINHGLSSAFVFPKKINPDIPLNGVNICYIGNLLINSLDRKTFRIIIEKNETISFTFFGNFNINDYKSYNHKDEEIKDFVHFLKTKKNVTLKEVCEPSYIAQKLSLFDAFLVLLDNKKDINKGSNSHKIIEYLSTGKVVISSYISTYDNSPSLIEMCDENSNEMFPELFKRVVSNLEYYNSNKFQHARIEFALDNTYDKQIQRIERALIKD
jgi:hypothetical protein